MLENLLEWTGLPEGWRAPAVGAAVSGLVLVVGLLLLRRGPRARAALDVGEQLSTAGNADRRLALRRTGNPVDVVITSQPGQGEWRCWVLDRSVGGLRLGSERPVRPGQVLQVRPLKGAESA